MGVPWVFVRVNQVLVRLWALPSHSLTECLRVFSDGRVFRGVKCCVLSKSDSAMCGDCSLLSAGGLIGHSWPLITDH